MLSYDVDIMVLYAYNKNGGVTMQNDDFIWFVDHYEELYEKYGVCYLVISNETVLGCYQNPKDAISETIKTVPLGRFIVQLCNGDESGYTNYIASAEIKVI